MTDQLPSNRWWDQNIDPDLAQAIIAFKLTLNKKEVTRDWRVDAEIDYDSLEDDLMKCSSIYSFWSAVLSEARKALRVIEFKIEIKRGNILKQMSTDFKEGMKLTQADKNDMINLDKDYALLKVQHIETELTVSKLFGIVDSLKMKADNLRSLAGFKRQELSGS